MLNRRGGARLLRHADAGMHAEPPLFGHLATTPAGFVGNVAESRLDCTGPGTNAHAALSSYVALLQGKPGLVQH